MKCRIYISGQISGNCTLMRKIGENAINRRKTAYGGFIYYYDKIADAKEDMNEAYKSLKREEPEIAGSFQLFISKDKEMLSYDASHARIEKFL